MLRLPVWTTTIAFCLVISVISIPFHYDQESPQRVNLVTVLGYLLVGGPGQHPCIKLTQIAHFSRWPSNRLRSSLIYTTRRNGRKKSMYLWTVPAIDV